MIIRITYNIFYIWLSVKKEREQYPDPNDISESQRRFVVIAADLRSRKS